MGSVANNAGLGGVASGNPLLTGYGANGVANANGFNPLDPMNAVKAIDPAGLMGKAKGANLGPAGGAPNQANIQQGTSIADVAKAQKNTGNSLQDQQNLLAALQAQNGLGQQTAAAGMQQGLAGQLGGANGVGIQTGAVSGLQGLAGQYQNIANGTGPNPAQAMLNQQTGQNVANQAALMAGQRGAGSNVGLMARQAAQQGAATQQQSVGQGATLEAQQRMNALAGIGNTQSAIGGLGGALTGQQMGANQAYANQANQLAGQQIGQVNQNAASNLQNQQQMQNALQGVNNAAVGSQGSVNAGDVSLSTAQTQAKAGIFGGLMNSAGAGAGMLGGKAAPAAAAAPVGQAYGGEIHMADGGVPGTMPPIQQPVQGPQSSFGQFLNNYQDPAANEKQVIQNNNPQPTPVKNTDSSDIASIASVAALMAGGGLAEDGGNVNAKSPDQKAVAPGNSYANDKIPAKLSEGEIVIPRDVLSSSDPVAAAAEFVRKTLSEKSAPKQNFDDGGGVKGQDALVADAPIQDMPAGAPAETSVPAEAAPPAPPVTPDAPPAQTPAAPPKIDRNSPEARLEEAMKVSQDYATRQIKPETWQGLFANKDTVGKVGTIFGLLLSGAGSGLAHQSNALLDVMNKEIDRDLEAQKTTKEGARNFLSLQYQHQLQKAQEADLEEGIASSEDARAGLGQKNRALNKRITESAGGKWDPSLEQAPAAIRANADAKNHMLLGIGQYLDDGTQNNPQGNAFLKNTVEPAIVGEVKKNITDSHAKATLAGALAPKAAPIQGNGINEKKYQKLLGDSQLGIVTPGFDPAAAKDEFKIAKDSRSKMKVFFDSYNKLDKLGAGKLNPQAHQAEEKALTAAGIPELIPFLPSGTDFGEARDEKARKAFNEFQKREASLTNLTQNGILPPLEDPGRASKSNKDALAMKWAKEHPADPRAKKIMSIGKK